MKVQNLQSDFKPSNGTGKSRRRNWDAVFTHDKGFIPLVGSGFKDPAHLGVAIYSAARGKGRNLKVTTRRGYQGGKLGVSFTILPGNTRTTTTRAHTR